MTEKSKSYLKQLLKFAFAFALVYWLVNRGDLDFRTLLKVMTPKYLLMGSTILLLSLLVNHLRWVLMLRARSFSVKFWETFPLTLMGIFFNFAMPGAVGGDMAKIYYITRGRSERKMDAGATVLVDRVVGLYVMMLMAFIASLLNYDLIQSNSAIAALTFSLGVLLAVATVCALLFLSPWVRGLNFKGSWAQWKVLQMLFRLISIVRQYRDHKVVLFQCGFLSIVSQMFAVFFFLVVAMALSEEVSFVATVFSVCLGFIVSALPISPGGVGVGQVAFHYFFEAYTGKDLQVGAVGITMDQVILFGIGLVGLLYFIKVKNFNPQKIETAYDR